MSSQIAAPKSIARLVTGSSRRALFGAAISVIGLAHILIPELFESLNRQMFTHNIRCHVYINGAIETLIGVAVIAPRARRFVPVFGALYVTYLGGNVIRRRRASAGGA